MATNLTIESPDFDRIRKGVPRATEDAIRLLWYVLNDLSRRQSVDFATLQARAQWTILSDAPVAAQNNYDAKANGVVLFTGGTAFNLTGVRNGVGLLLIANLGLGTVTLKQESANSDAANRIDLAAGVDKAVATNKFALLSYLNSRWREVSLA